MQIKHLTSLLPHQLDDLVMWIKKSVFNFLPVLIDFLNTESYVLMFTYVVPYFA